MHQKSRLFSLAEDEKLSTVTVLSLVKAQWQTLFIHAALCWIQKYAPKNLNIVILFHSMGPKISYKIQTFVLALKCCITQTQVRLNYICLTFYLLQAFNLVHLLRWNTYSVVLSQRDHPHIKTSWHLFLLVKLTNKPTAVSSNTVKVHSVENPCWRVSLEFLCMSVDVCRCFLM